MLWERALDNHGLITTRDAAALNVPAVECRKLAARGFMDHIAYGVYRVHDVPASEYDQFAEAVVRVGPDAYLSHDAVLALHDLAQVNPRRICVGTPHRVRSTWPDYLDVLHRALPEDDLTAYDGIPSATVARALIDCREFIMTDRLLAAAEQAQQRGLLTRRQRLAVDTALGLAVTQ
jgi:predicted transcriptional regulator of viral defense system